MKHRTVCLCSALAALVLIAGCDDDSGSSNDNDDSGSSSEIDDSTSSSDTNGEGTAAVLSCDGITEGLRSDEALDDSLSPVAFDPTMAYCLSGELTSEEGRISRQVEVSPGSYTLGGPDGKAFAWQVRPVDVTGTSEAIDVLHISVNPDGDGAKQIVFAASQPLTVEISAVEWSDDATSVQSVKTLCSDCESTVDSAEVELVLSRTGEKLSDSTWKNRWRLTEAVPGDDGDPSLTYTVDMMETASGLFYEPVGFASEAGSFPVSGTDPVGFMYAVVTGDIGNTVEVEAASGLGFYLTNGELTVNSEGTEISGDFECTPPGGYSCPDPDGVLGVAVSGFPASPYNP